MWAARFGEELALPNGYRWADVEVGRAHLRMRYLEPGDFVYGDNLEPRRIENGFWIGSTAVTRAFYREVMGEDPNWLFDGASGPEHPVQNVSWDDCQSFCERLNRMVAGGSFRLPTEREWEYGCRAGTRTVYWWGDSCNGTECNCDGDYPYGTDVKGPDLGSTTPVTAYVANPWGLYNVHGNVWDWCSDWKGEYPLVRRAHPRGPATGTRRVVRGGSRSNPPSFCRSAKRGGGPPDFESFNYGFRCARDLPFSEPKPPAP